MKILVFRENMLKALRWIYVYSEINKKQGEGDSFLSKVKLNK